MTGDTPAPDRPSHERPARAHTVLVTVDVQPDKIDEFIDAIAANAQASLAGDYGCLAFDVHQDPTVPTRFYLHEIYSSKAAFEVRHRSTAHYWDWKKVSAQYIAEGGQHITFAEHIDTRRPVGVGHSHGTEN